MSVKPVAVPCRTFSLTRRTWYMLLLFLPLAMPILVVLLETLHWLLISGGEPFAEDFLGNRSIMGLMLFSLVFGGLQYLVFIFVLMVWGGDKHVDTWWRISWLLPLLYVPMCASGLFVILDFQNAEATFQIALMSLVFGYLYVAFVHFMTWLLKTLSLIRD